MAKYLIIVALIFCQFGCDVPKVPVPDGTIIVYYEDGTKEIKMGTPADFETIAEYGQYDRVEYYERNKAVFRRAWQKKEESDVSKKAGSLY